jgi:hypothetical protein
MRTIAVKQFCKHYNVPSSFIDSLSNFEIIELVEVENTKNLHTSDIQRIEKMIRLHYDLNVNFEGLDIINNLTSQIVLLQNEIINLKKQIDFYK